MNNKECEHKNKETRKTHFKDNIYYWPTYCKDCGKLFESETDFYAILAVSQYPLPRIVAVAQYKDSTSASKIE